MLGLTERSEVTVYFPCPFPWFRLGLLDIICLASCVSLMCTLLYASLSIYIYIYIYTEAFAVETFGAQMPC